MHLGLVADMLIAPFPSYYISSYFLGCLWVIFIFLYRPSFNLCSFYYMQVHNFNTLYERSRVNMVKNQLMTLDCNNQALLEYFLRIPRELFVSEQNMDICYIDSDIVEVDNLMFRPETLFKILHKMEIKRSDSVLVTNSGYGYIPCIISQHGCKVIAVENCKDSIAHFTHNLTYLKFRNIELRSVDIDEKLVVGAPFDKIFVNKLLRSRSELSEILLSQLAEGGCLVATIRQDSGEYKTYFFKKVGSNDIYEEVLD